jgi:chromosome segregation ATPase
MANENKNIKELVSDDDDPTAELEIPSFQLPEDSEDLLAEQESDSHTCGLNDADDADLRRMQSIPELQSDLKSRSRTIGQLQYDIQQLRSKWLGLEAEIGAREEIVSNLLNENEKLTRKITRKQDLLKKRSASIKTLKSEIRQREEDRLSLEEKLAAQALADEENAKSIETAARDLSDARTEIDAANTALVEAEGQLRQREEDSALLEEELAAQALAIEENSKSLEATTRELDNARGDIEVANTALADSEAKLQQRDQEYGQLQQQLDDQQAISTEKATALEKTTLELESIRAELQAAALEEHNLNQEINQRDNLESTLEQTIAGLKEQVGSLNSTEAELAAELHAARQEQARLNLELETTREKSTAEIAQTKKTTSSIVKELNVKLAKTEEYADSLRFKLQDSDDVLVNAAKLSDALHKEVDSLAAQNVELSAELDAAKAANEEFLVSIEKLAADHEQELRTLRFELTDAQDSIVQTDDINTQLTSDLVDARNFKEELERMLMRTEEDAQGRITDLEQKIAQLSGTAEEFEQKLDTKNTAINVLLGELAKKTEQLDSICEIEEVIQEIDDRMSERIDEHEAPASDQHDSAPVVADRDRITRVLVGNIGEQELRFPLFKNRLTIGRTADNDIQLNAAYISRRHAVVLTEGDATRVIDWGSKNGVYVNTERVKERFLSNGDIVAIGNAKFRYEERPKRDA